MTRKQKIKWYKRMIILREKEMLENVKRKGYYIFCVTRKDIAKPLARFIEALYGFKCEIKHRGYGSTDIIIKI